MQGKATHAGDEGIVQALTRPRAQAKVKRERAIFKLCQGEGAWDSQDERAEECTLKEPLAL
jgi:hypothetical protein